MFSVQKVADDVKLALEVVSYIGCVVSIICLIATVVFFLCQGYAFNQKIWLIEMHCHVNLNCTL